jgi:hypothetical protein
MKSNVNYMARFLKFTNILLNTNDINKIVIKSNKYLIYVMGKKINGFVFVSISSHSNEIEVCETKHTHDYKIVTE